MTPKLFISLPRTILDVYKRQTYYALGAEGETMFSGFNNVNSGEDANWTATGFGVRKYMPCLLYTSRCV